MPAPRTCQAALVWAATIVTAGLSRVAVPGMETFVDTVAVGSILLAGLPHGALDLAELRADPTIGSRATTIVVVYLLLFGGAAFLWWFQASVALSAFLILSIWHFAVEWREDLPVLVALPAAALLVSLPAAVWPAAVTSLFASLCGNHAFAAELTTFGGMALLPIVLLLVIAAVLWPVPRSEAVILLGLGVAETVVSPLQSFAIFFALVHSPRHLARTADARNWSVSGAYGRALPLTIAALFVFAALISVKSWTQPDAAPFLLLAILAVPHMFSAPVLRFLVQATAEAERRSAAIPDDRTKPLAPTAAPVGGSSRRGAAVERRP